MTSIVITPFDPDHAEELKCFIENELDNADFEGELMPSCVETIDVRQLQQINANLLAALTRLANEVPSHIKLDVMKSFALVTAHAEAWKAIHQATEAQR